MKIQIKNDLHANGLSPGVAYAVIGIDDMHYRVINDNKEPVLYRNDIFDVMDPHVPEHWIRREYSDGEFYLEPPEFSEIGFFEDYFDGKKSAVVEYNRYLVLSGIKK